MLSLNIRHPAVSNCSLNWYLSHHLSVSISLKNPNGQMRTHTHSMSYAFIYSGMVAHRIDSLFRAFWHLRQLSGAARHTGAAQEYIYAGLAVSSMECYLSTFQHLDMKDLQSHWFFCWVLLRKPEKLSTLTNDPTSSSVIQSHTAQCNLFVCSCCTWRVQVEQLLPKLPHQYI